MSKISNNNWKWIIFFLAAVLTYFFLDIVDAGRLLRQILVFPVCFIGYLLFQIFGIQGLVDLLDVDTSAKVGIFYRVCAFAVELGAALLPVYLYVQTKKKTYLVLSGIVIAWIIVSYCFFFFIFLSMIGMTD